MLIGYYTLTIKPFVVDGSSPVLISQRKQVQRSVWSNPVFSWSRRQFSLSFVKSGYSLNKLPFFFWRTVQVISSRFQTPVKFKWYRWDEQSFSRSSRGHRETDRWKEQPSHHTLVSSTAITFVLEKWGRSLVLFIRKGRKSWILEGKIKIWSKANGFVGGHLGLGQAIPPSSPAADCKKCNISQPLREFSLPNSSEHTFFNSHHALIREGIIHKWGNWGPEWLGNPGSKCGAEMQIQAPWPCSLTLTPVPKWVGDCGVGIRNNPFGHCLCAHGWGPWGRCPCTGGQSSSVMNTVLEWYQHQQQKKTPESSQLNSPYTVIC